MQKRGYYLVTRTSLELHYKGKNSFYHDRIKISEYYDLPDFDPNNLSEAKIKLYIDMIKQKYITYWQHTFHHSKKLLTILQHI